MKIDTQGHGTVTVLAPHGPLTHDEAPVFRAAADAAIAERQGRVVLDFADVPYFDSAGIETLLDLYASSTTAHRARLARLSDTCREALDLTNCLERLEIFDTVENAIRSYKR